MHLQLSQQLIGCQQQQKTHHSSSKVLICTNKQTKLRPFQQQWQKSQYKHTHIQIYVVHSNTCFGNQATATCEQ